GGTVTERDAAGAAVSRTVVRPARRLLSLAGIMAMAASGVIVGWWARPAPAEPPVRRFEIANDRTYRMSTTYGSAALSPNGKKIAWLGTGRIWIRDLDRVEPRPIETARDPEMLAWSPDSAWLAFEAEGKLWKVSADGGEPEHIVDLEGQVAGSEGASWGPDDRILFTMAGRGLYEVSARGGDPRSILEPDPGTESDLHEPSFLPGGKGILFVSHTRKAHPDTLVLLAGGVRKVLLHLEGQTIHEPVYDRGGYILYARTPGSAGVWALPFSLSRLEVEGEPFLVVADGSRPTVSNDGTLLYVTAPTAHRIQMVWVDRQGKEMRKVGGPEDILPVRPSLSPDGRRVAVVKDDGETQDIWIYDTDGGTGRPLTFGEGYKHTPVWSHSGDWIAYNSGTDAANAKIWLVAANGSSEPEELTGGALPSFSPGDNEIVFMVYGEKQRPVLARLSLQGERRATTFLQSAADLFAPAVSPDGRYLAYVSTETGRDEVFITHYPDASGKWQVSVNGGDWPLWSAKGDQLYFAAGDDVMAVDIGTTGSLSLGSPRKLFTRSPLGWPLFHGWPPSFCVTPDGQRLLIFENATTENKPVRLHVVESWAAQFRK
ncbi:MAG TPA: hypothetical protein VNI57_03215, partial [Candidatus Saccharimonadales bacterium]|nr:hypothetical protein [Candidatus Saccharimonadales bacterium]